jgi:diguanylate cyclase (GGDEF)-like protein/PAS domain S-box-containing protein
LTTSDDRIRERYPHTPPDEKQFEGGVESPEYKAALLQYCGGQAELTQGFFEAVPYPAVTTLHDGTFAFANAPAQQLFGLTPTDLPNHRANDFLFDAQGRPIGVSIGERIITGEVIRSEAVYVRRPDGHLELRMLSVAPVKAQGTQTLVRAIGLFLDPTPAERELESLRMLNRELNRELERLSKESVQNLRLAHTDEMTGLPNARAYWNAIRQATEDQRIERGSMAVFYFDCDGFRANNEKYGHPCVNNMIRAVATRLRAVTDSHKGFVARVGGDEFVAFFRGVSEATYGQLAAAFTDALRFRFDACEKGKREKTQILISVSIGGAIHLNGEIPELGEFEGEAEDAMYESKHSGRGEEKRLRCVLRSAPTHSPVPPKP